MIVLGIETATSVCSVGLAGDSGLIAESRLIREHSHAEVLSTMADNVCEAAKVPLKTVDGIADSNGPGSFTGLRIGLGYAKGLAFGAERKFITIPTLEAMIWPIAPVCSWACVLLVARKGEAYRGVFHWENGQWVKDRDHKIVSEDAPAQALPDERILFVGNGSRQFEAILKKDKRVVLLDQGYDYPSGYSVAALGRERLMAGESANLDEAVPQYLKRFQGVA